MKENITEEHYHRRQYDKDVEEDEFSGEFLLNQLPLSSNSIKTNDSRIDFVTSVFDNYNNNYTIISPQGTADTDISLTPWLLLTPLPVPWKIAYLILAVVIVTTNFVIIFIFCYSRRSRKQMGLFLLNLAVVDLQNGLLSIPFLIFYPRSRLTSPTDITAASCVLLVTWPQILYTVAYQSVFLVTVERFISVSKPFVYNKLLQRKKIGIGIVFGVWTLAIMICLIPTFNYVINKAESKLTLCNGIYKAGVVYLQMFLLTMIVIPFVINLVLYVLMYKVARKHLNSLEKLKVQKSKKEVKKHNVQDDVIKENGPLPSPKTRSSSLKIKKSKKEEQLISLTELEPNSHFSRSATLRSSSRMKRSQYENGKTNSSHSSLTAGIRSSFRSSMKRSSSSPLLGYFRRTVQASFKRRQIMRASKAAKTTCFLSAFYILSWLPFILFVQINSLCTVNYCISGTINTEMLQRGLPYAMFLAFLGSAANPTIYILRNSVIKLEIKNIVCKRVAVKFQQDPFTSNNTRQNSLVSKRGSIMSRRFNVSFREQESSIC